MNKTLMTNKIEKLEDLTNGSVITIQFGFENIRAIVIGNNGKYITWYKNTWLKSSAITSTYKEIEEMNWSHIGYLKKVFLFFKKIELYDK